MTRTTRTTRSGAFLLTTLAVAFVAGTVLAQQPPDGRTTDERAMGNMAHREHMTAMMASMRASDQKLDDLVKVMNAAPGEARIDAIAAVVRELVASRKAANSEMMSMHEMMMSMMTPGGAMMKGMTPKEQ